MNIFLPIFTFGFFAVIILGISIVFYIFQSLAIYKIANCRNIENAWLSFIPIANYYLIGKIGDDINAERKEKSNYRKIILIFTILFSFFILIVITLIFSFINFSHSQISQQIAPQIFLFFISYIVLLIFSIINCVFLYISIFKIYQRYYVENSTLYIVLSIIISVVTPFLLFSVSKRAEKYHENPQKFEFENGPCRPYYSYNPAMYSNQNPTNANNPTCYTKNPQQHSNTTNIANNKEEN